MFSWHKKILSILIFVGLSLPSLARGEMSSTNYQIYADTVGWGGGSYSGTSTSYSVNDTIGEWPAGVVSSTGNVYELRGGFVSMDRGSLDISVSASSLSLGELSVSTVKDASTVVTVSATSDTGYTLSISSVSGIMPHAIGVGESVTAGTEGYGLSVGGTDKAFSGDKAVGAGLILASTLAPATSATTLTFKAAMSGSSSAGSYSQTVVLTAAANF